MTHYLLSAKNSYEQNFFSIESRGISELYKVGITQNKNNLSDHWREEGSSVLTGSQIVALRETTVWWTGAWLR